jgi:hypothetical protein
MWYENSQRYLDVEIKTDNYGGQDREARMLRRERGEGKERRNGENLMRSSKNIVEVERSMWNSVAYYGSEMVPEGGKAIYIPCLIWLPLNLEQCLASVGPDTLLIERIVER